MKKDDVDNQVAIRHPLSANSSAITKNKKEPNILYSQINGRLKALSSFKTEYVSPTIAIKANVVIGIKYFMFFNFAGTSGANNIKLAPKVKYTSTKPTL